jgi:hypothetical protein
MLTVGCYKKNVPESPKTFVNSGGEPINFKTDNISSISILDSTQYSKRFLHGLNELGSPDNIELSGDLLIVNQDTVHFPSFPIIGKQIIYSGSNKNLQCSLHIKRIKFSTIEFEFQLYDSDKLIYSDKGEADILAGFFLGSESDGDESGEAFQVDEYSKVDSLTYFTVRITDKQARIECGFQNRSSTYSYEELPILFIQ